MPRITNIELYFSQKQLPRKMKSRLIIIARRLYFLALVFAVTIELLLLLALSTKRLLYSSIYLTFFRSYPIFAVSKALHCKQDFLHKFRTSPFQQWCLPNCSQKLSSSSKHELCSETCINIVKVKERTCDLESYTL